MALNLNEQEELELLELEREQAAATPAAPTRQTFEQQMATRRQLEAEGEKLGESKTALEREVSSRVFKEWMRATGGALKAGENQQQAATEWAAKNRPELAARLEEIKSQRELLSEEAGKLGASERGRAVGSTIGAAVGGVGGGALGALAGPAGLAAGATLGSAAGSGLGSLIGSQFDVSEATDITEEEAAKLIRERAVEDVALDAAGSLLFFGGGKLLKVTGASKKLKDLASKFFAGAAETAAVPIAGEAAAKAAVPGLTETGRYVIPGKEGVTAKALEAVAGKTVAERAASRANQRVTNELVASDLGLDPAEEITQEALAAVRAKAGKVYKEAKELPGRISADNKYKDALAEMRDEIEVADFPDLDIGKAVLNRIQALTVPGMSSKSLIQAAKKLRGEANSLAAKGDFEAARFHRDLAEELDDLLERSAPKGLVDRLKSARQIIAKSYDAERALTAGDIDARKLASLSKKRPLTGGLKEAAEFGARSPKFTQPPRTEGLDTGNVLTDIALGGVAGTGGAYAADSPSAFPAAGAAAILGRRGSIAALRGIYNRASRQGNQAAARHAARLIALQQGAMTGAKAQLAKESAEALASEGFLPQGEE